MTKSVEGLARGLRVFELIRDRGPIALAPLSCAAELPKATVLRMVKTLEESGWIARRLNDGQYISGARPDQPDTRARLTRAGQAPLVQLTTQTGLAADLVAVTAVGSLEVVDSTRTRRPGGVDPLVAGFRPSMVFSAPGRAILAFNNPGETNRLIAHAEAADSPAIRFEIRSGRLERALEETRRLGFGFRAEGYWPASSDYGAPPMDIAVPISGRSGIVGTVGLVWPAEEARAEQIATRHGNALTEAQKRIEKAVR